MKHFSHTELHAVCGDVLPLWIEGGEEFDTVPVAWKSSSPCVQITEHNSGRGPFTSGVLLTMLAEGEAEITAVVEEERLSCRVTVTALPSSEGKELNYYIGDLHDHTHKCHRRDDFCAREDGFPADYIRQVREEGKLDFGVVSDHAGLLNRKEFFRGFRDAAREAGENFLVFSGCEAEVTVVEEDRFGVPHKNSGEIVTILASEARDTKEWESFYEQHKTSPFTVATLAHPQVSGLSMPGIWNFSLHKRRDPRFMKMLHLVEMGDGTDRQSNLVNEYVYSVALDQGFFVSTTCSSDSHGPLWGFTRFPGKSIIMAPEKSRGAFIAALHDRRIYASESGNVKLKWSVNDVVAPAVIGEKDVYRIRAQWSLFREEETASLPVKCQILSDGGKPVATVNVEGAYDLDLTLSVKGAHYFFLRLVDGEGRKTWSVPVRTDREGVVTSDEALPEEGLIPVPKTGMTVTELLAEEDASILLSENPEQSYTCQGTAASLLLDMQEEKDVCALGLYPPILHQKRIKEEGLLPHHKLAELPSEYRLSVSCDGEIFTPVASGLVRIFGAETIIRFSRQRVRYLRLDIPTTVGRACELKKFFSARVTLGELTPFTK